MYVQDHSFGPFFSIGPFNFLPMGMFVQAPMSGMRKEYTPYNNMRTVFFFSFNRSSIHIPEYVIWKRRECSSNLSSWTSSRLVNLTMNLPRLLELELEFEGIFYVFCHFISCIKFLRIHCSQIRTTSNYTRHKKFALKIFFWMSLNIFKKKKIQIHQKAKLLTPTVMFYWIKKKSFFHQRRENIRDLNTFFLFDLSVFYSCRIKYDIYEKWNELTFTLCSNKRQSHTWLWTWN